MQSEGDLGARRGTDASAVLTAEAPGRPQAPSASAATQMPAAGDLGASCSTEATEKRPMGALAQPEPHWKRQRCQRFKSAPPPPRHGQQGSSVFLTQDADAAPAPEHDSVTAQQLSYAPRPPSPPPALLPQRKRLHIFTFGLEKLGPFLADICRNYARGGAEALISVEMLRMALRRRGVGEVSLIHDTRRFRDPAGVGSLSRSLRNHVGIHPENLRGMVQHRAFSGWIRHLRDDVMEAFRDAAELSLAFYCKSGRHRSVAAARFMQHFAEFEGWSVQVEHLSRFGWGRTCSGLCAECRDTGAGGGDVRRDALAHALSIWRWDSSA